MFKSIYMFGEAFRIHEAKSNLGPEIRPEHVDKLVKTKLYNFTGLKQLKTLEPSFEGR